MEALDGSNNEDIKYKMLEYKTSIAKYQLLFSFF